MATNPRVHTETLLPISGDREKARVALTSVVAAVFLTGFKLVVGFASGSLGILAEALHSGLDLVAAIMTYGAVRISSIPPDESHHYGHGKVESFSALLETLLLVATCVWIIVEAIERLWFKAVEIDPSIWAFVVMITSVVVDYGRSKALLRAARKYQSQALEADALHFSTDIWSSAVVIIGLVVVRIGEGSAHKAILFRADALAALGVACIVLWVSWRLGKETIDALMDRAPSGLARRIIETTLDVPGVLDCNRVRLRQVGPALFVDMVILIDPATLLGDAHAIASAVEENIRRLKEKTDVMVHVEPQSLPEIMHAAPDQN